MICLICYTDSLVCGQNFDSRVGCCIFRPGFGCSALQMLVKIFFSPATSVLGANLKTHFFAKFCGKILFFAIFQLFRQRNDPFILHRDLFLLVGSFQLNFSSFQSDLYTFLTPLPHATPPLQCSCRQAPPYLPFTAPSQTTSLSNNYPWKTVLLKKITNRCHWYVKPNKVA